MAEHSPGKPETVGSPSHRLTYAEALRQAQAPVEPNLDPGPEYAAGRRLFQGIPGIERAPSGRLWATWYAGGQDESPLNYVILTTSADNGATWSDPILVIDGPGHVRTAGPNLWLDPHGKLWLTWVQAHTLHDGRWGVWAILTDDPDSEHPTWSPPRRLSDGVKLNKPTVRSNGEWLFPVSLLAAKALGNENRMLPRFLRRDILGLMSPEEVQAVDEREGACVYVSNDGGQTFVDRGRARGSMETTTHNEHMIIERRDGSLWMWVRTTYGIGTSASTDGGATWTPVAESGIPHTGSRFFISRLRSGNLLLVKHGPMDPLDAQGEPVVIKRSHLFAYLSDDDGASWKGCLLLEERVCTYPDATQAPDGNIYVIYDHGRRQEKMVLMATFTEDDILAGAFTSAQARQGVLIDQATGVIPDEENWKRIHALDAPGESLIPTGI